VVVPEEATVRFEEVFVDCSERAAFLASGNEIPRSTLLVVRLIEPVNCVLQRTAKSKPFVVRVDKLKKCFSAAPTSWLQTGSIMIIRKEIVDQKQSRERHEKSSTRVVVVRVHRCNASQLHIDPLLVCRLRKH